MKFRQFDTEYVGYFEQEQYGNNSNLAVQLMSWEDDGGYWTPHATISINTDLILPPDEFVAKNYNESEGLPESLLALGYFEDTGKRTSFGHCRNVPIYRLTDKFRAEVGVVPEAPVSV